MISMMVHLELGAVVAMGRPMFGLIPVPVRWTYVPSHRGVGGGGEPQAARQARVGLPIGDSMYYLPAQC